MPQISFFSISTLQTPSPTTLDLMFMVKQPDVLPGRTNGEDMEIAQRQEPEVLR